MAENKQPWVAVFDRVRVRPREPFFRPYPPVSEEELDRAEAQLGHRLPRSYRAFMTRFGPGEVHGWARLHQISPIHEQLADYTLTENTLYHQRKFRREPEGSDSLWRARLIYFAWDPCGDPFGWDPTRVTDIGSHEYRAYYFPDKAGRSPVEMGGTFWEFLERVAAEWGVEAEAGSIVGGLNDFDSLCNGIKRKPSASDIALWLAWNNYTVRDLARSIRDRGQTDAYPILADALQEAGCTNADLLDSCRTGDPDIDGVWVLRVLLCNE